MKYSQYRAFEKHLIGASPHHFADFYLILSKDEFERKLCLDKVVEHLLKDEKQREMAFKSYSAEQTKIDTIWNEISTPSFFIKRQVVVIRHIDLIKTATLKELEKFFDHPLKHACIVFEGGSLTAASTFYKKAEKAGVIVEIAAPEKAWEKEKHVAEWLPMMAAEEGKKIHPQAALALIHNLGSDKGGLYQELQKLLCYIGERNEITTEDVSAISLTFNQETIWQLGEAIFKDDASSVLRITKGLMQNGSALIPLLRQIRSQFQTEFQISSILAYGGSTEEVSAAFPRLKGTFLSKHIQAAQYYGYQRLKNGIIEIDKTEVEAKNSNTDPEILAELLMMKLVTI